MCFSVTFVMVDFPENNKFSAKFHVTKFPKVQNLKKKKKKKKKKICDIPSPHIHTL